MILVVEHQHPLTPGERTDDMSTSTLPPSGGYPDQPQGEVCPPVSTGGGAFFQTCTRCGVTEPSDAFHRQKRVRSGLQPVCKSCRKAYRDEHHEDHLRRGRDYQKRASKKIRQRKAEYHAANKHTLNPARSKQLAARYRQDPSFRIVKCLRVRLRDALIGAPKHRGAKALIGCSVEELWGHLESLFEHGMTRDNYGAWHVDHIRPCSSFDLTDLEQQKKCFHWTNLQPLWAADNLKKWAHYNNRQEEG